MVIWLLIAIKIQRTTNEIDMTLTYTQIIQFPHPFSFTSKLTLRCRVIHLLNVRRQLIGLNLFLKIFSIVKTIEIMIWWWNYLRIVWGSNCAGFLHHFENFRPSDHNSQFQVKILITEETSLNFSELSHSICKKIFITYNIWLCVEAQIDCGRNIFMFACCWT